MSISMGREGYDDWRRHRQDKAENNRTALVARLNLNYDGRDDALSDTPVVYEEVAWKDIRVGDIIKLGSNDWVPADIILLHSENNGMAYIETMALDGETNLKTREPLPRLQEICGDDKKLATLNAFVKTEDPNLDLYNFEAAINIEARDYPLSSSHIVYRGSILRNTSSALGLAVFTGEESKIRMNAIQNPRSKSPRLQKKVNNIVICMVIFVLALSVFCTVACKVYYNTSGYRMWYLTGLEVGVVPNLMGFIIMFNTLIPLSLYVSMEIIKVVQMVLLQKDIDMYDAVSDTPCEARTASINEELGQVSYIFSDKTGTLTDNVMIFRKLSIAGVAWLHDIDIQMEAIEAEEAAAAAAAASAAATAAELESSHAGKKKSLLFKRADRRRAGAGAVVEISGDRNDFRDTSDNGKSAHKHSERVSEVVFSPAAPAAQKRSRSALRKSEGRGTVVVSQGSSAGPSGTAGPSSQTRTSISYTPRPSTDSILRQVAALPRKSTSGVSRKSSTYMKRPSGVSAKTSIDYHRKSSGLPRKSMASLGRVTSVNTWKSTANPTKVQDIKSTLELIEYLILHPNSIYARKARFFLLSIALCHSCLPESDQHESADGEVEIESLDYSAASPDELALVAAARDMGYLLIDRQHNKMTIRTYPNGFDEGPVDEVYEILEIIEFSSARKRMSIVVRFPDGRICVFCKGADNVILERLRQSSLALEKAQEIQQQSSLRKAAEAEVVIARNSLSSLNRTSITGTGRLSFSRPSFGIDRKDALASLDNHLNRSHQDHDIEQIAESSRRSMSLARQRKYGESTVPTATGSSNRRGRVSFDGARRSRDLIRKSSFHAGDADNSGVYGESGDDGDDSIDNIGKIQAPIDDHLVLNDNYVMEKTLEHIEEFSTEGLRTLLYSYRWMPKEEYDNWKKLYQDARTSLVNRQEKVEKVGEAIEHDFELCGATAIEDKLQDGVPEAIDKLRRANIKLWMLTGDKRETAINIGYSCRLIKDYSTVVILRSDEGDVAGKMAAAMIELDNNRVAHCVVVVDGITLSHIEHDMTLMSLFIDLGVKADSVICCRASPSQKASMVKAVRKKVKSSITLAIGDGANDIAMIQSADVGIGITGKEGLQAARSSDYSIAQFRYLLKLLLVHGRWNYVRTCKYILGTFYKEFLFYLTQAIFQGNTMFTGTSLYENWSLSMFNTLFTSLPVLCIGIFEKDLEPATLIAVPELYAKGQQNQAFGLLIFLGWMVIAASQSVMVSFLTYYLYGFHAIVDNTLYPLGVISFTSIIILICTKLQLLEMHYITVINVGTMVLSIGGWMCWNMFLSYIYSKKPSKIYFVAHALFEEFGTDLSFWTTILVIFGVGLTFEVVVRLARSKVLQNETDVFQELEKNADVRNRLEEEAFEELHYSLSTKRSQLDAEARVSGLSSGNIRLPPRQSGSSIIAHPQNFYDDYSDEDVSRPLPRSGTRQKLKKMVKFGRKTSGEYEREIQEILKRRQQELDMEY
ncbi:aminophospholipid-translocating P4-type ATPase DNF3 [Sugiyamaella lignohabitans]|uniref:Phospholipid-transporting ATPase n=1 Tax=Sugiyamaella lignohabitans TaxID=796027 RepID=A0A167CC88_9ASCO|nr:aminophospholipid-translocating P4-type ATPase DNF3 [Sugiyamaella lignohabitans]ANB11495.1 aminophospholipid-translocating P4-type ATPase DNF3 [Sugiyamaella lignohabitans]